jgi:hypothetical protein
MMSEHLAIEKSLAARCITAVVTVVVTVAHLIATSFTN